MIISMERQAGLLLMAAVSVAGPANAGFILDNGPGSGSVNIHVDGYGSFGSGFSAGTSTLPGPAIFRTADGRSGDVGPFSATLIGFGGDRLALTSGSLFGNGNLPEVAVTDDNGTGVSSFTLPAAGASQPALLFNLRQSLQPLFSGIARTGSILVQEYSITNQSTAIDAEFEAVRFFDSDLAFDSATEDGGGLLNLQGDDFVFVTDRSDAQVGTAATEFTGLAAINNDENGFVGGLYGVLDNFDGLAVDNLLDGVPLDNSIFGDGDADGFVDPDAATNLAIAYSSSYILSPGSSTTFLALTIFGSGAPADVTPNPQVDPPPVPAPASLLLVLLGLLGMRKLRNY